VGASPPGRRLARRRPRRLRGPIRRSPDASAPRDRHARDVPEARNATMSLPQYQPAPTAVHVQRANPLGMPTAINVLGRAFLDDPVFAWVIPDRETRRRN